MLNEQVILRDIVSYLKIILYQRMINEDEYNLISNQKLPNPNGMLALF